MSVHCPNTHYVVIQRKIKIAYLGTNNFFAELSIQRGCFGRERDAEKGALGADRESAEFGNSNFGRCQKGINVVKTLEEEI